MDSHEATVNTRVENEKKDEPHYHVQKQETADFNLNLGLDTAKINPSNDTGELEKALASHTPEKLEIMDGGKINEEAETEIQMPNTAIESMFQKFSNFNYIKTSLGFIFKQGIADIPKIKSSNNKLYL